MDIGQIGTAALVIILAVLCVGGIVVGGLLLMFFRSGILGDLFGGVTGAMSGRDEDLGAGGLFGEEEGGSDYRSRRSDPYRRVDEIRARYDQQFHSGAGGDTGSDWTPGALPPEEDGYESFNDEYDAKRPYKRRFREENAGYDDEMDAYFDDTQL